MKPKTFRVDENIGRAKYAVTFYDGVKTHSDGSPFYDLHLATNKKKLNAFLKELRAEGYQDARFN